MGFSEVFDAAATATLGYSKNGQLEFLSEADIQAMIFHHAVTFAEKASLPLKIHAELSKVGAEPDLVLGHDEVFVEIKLSKSNSGGYKTALRNWHKDIEKLRQYRKSFPSARCVFLAVDDGPYLSNPSSTNFFDPSRENLKGDWK